MTNERVDQLPLPTDDSILAAAENELACTLPEPYRKSVTTIANGGFGPGYGIIGVFNGHSDSHGRTLVEAFKLLPTFVTKTGLQQIPRILPLWEWGAGITVCMDASGPNSQLFVIDEAGLTRSELTLFDALRRWADGEHLWNVMFESEEVLRPSPFSGGVMKVSRNLRAIGEHIASFGDMIESRVGFVPRVVKMFRRDEVSRKPRDLNKKRHAFSARLPRTRVE